MTVPLRLFDTAASMGAAAASMIVDQITRAAQENRRYLLGCPGGRSAASTYADVARRIARDSIPLDHVVIVMMDEYLVDSPTGLVAEDAEALHSCTRFARTEIVGPWHAAAPLGHGIAAEHLWVPDPADPAAYDNALTDAGGIDLFLLAAGASDGHLAFNPPGSTLDSTTRVVTLPDSTRSDNLATFTSFGGDLEAVPRHGVTVGLGTVATQSRSVLMLLHGADKGLAARRIAGAPHHEPDWPATVLADCADPYLFVDRAAARAGGLDVPTDL